MQWADISIIVTILSVIVGMATGYLRLFFKAELALFRERLVSDMARDFISRELHDARLVALENRVSRLEIRP